MSILRHLGGVPATCNHSLHLTNNCAKVPCHPLLKIAVPIKQEQHLQQHCEETFVAVNPYSVGLEQNPANFVALSPLSFLERSAFVYPKRISIIQDDRKYTWKESYDR